MSISGLKSGLCLFFEPEAAVVVKVGAVARLVVVSMAKPDFEPITLGHRPQRPVEHMVFLKAAHGGDVVFCPADVALLPGF